MDSDQNGTTINLKHKRCIFIYDCLTTLSVVKPDDTALIINE
jgi:hypothetical protein